MVKIYREFFKNGIIRKELYYDSETNVVSEMKRYGADGALLMHLPYCGDVTLDEALKSVNFPKTPLDASFLDEDALKVEDSRVAIESARETRQALEDRLREQRRLEQEAETRLKAMERYIGRTLGDNDLA